MTLRHCVLLGKDDGEGGACGLVIVRDVSSDVGVVRYL